MATSFPTDVQAFDADDRISFSRLDNKFIAVHDNGTEYEFEADLKRWIPVEDSEEEQDILERDAAEYGRDPSAPTADAGSRRRRPDTDNGDETAASTRPRKKQKPAPAPKQNTAVYVTGLPSDATVEEVHDLFSRKAGVVAEEIDSKAPRIKMYNNASGQFKGDALVVFFKPQSVEMAIMLLDDTDFRFNSSGTREGRISVQAADASYKKVQYDQEVAGSGQATTKREEKRPPPKKSGDRHKIIKKTQKLDAKLADWDDDDPSVQHRANASKWEKTVILTHMFTLQELAEDPGALLEIKEDIRDECSKLGTVTNVVLYDLEEEGIVSVKFREIEAASTCIRVMHGRNFDGRKVEAFMASGEEKFQRSRQNDAGDESD